MSMDPGDDPSRTEAHGASRDVPRRDAILAAARRVFAEKGYEAASLTEIVAEAGGSRRNVYAAFGGKRGLFEAAAEAVVAHAAASAGRPEADPADPEAWLTDTGRRFARAMLDPETMAILREMIATGAPSDHLWRAGPGRLRAALADWLRERDADGSLHVPDPEAAAAILPEMLKAPLQMEVLSGRREPPSTEEIDAHVDAAVALFLNGMRPRTDAM